MTQRPDLVVGAMRFQMEQAMVGFQVFLSGEVTTYTDLELFDMALGALRKLRDQYEKKAAVQQAQLGDLDIKLN
jgi:hypothetical protein